MNLPEKTQSNSIAIHDKSHPDYVEPEYGWYQDEADFILNLGSMKKAAVIRISLKGNYFIGTSSYFPFP